MPREWSVTTERLKQSANVIEEKKGKYDTEWQKLYTEVQNRVLQVIRLIRSWNPTETNLKNCQRYFRVITIFWKHQRNSMKKQKKQSKMRQTVCKNQEENNGNDKGKFYGNER